MWEARPAGEPWPNRPAWIARKTWPAWIARPNRPARPYRSAGAAAVMKSLDTGRPISSHDFLQVLLAQFNNCWGKDLLFCICSSETIVVVGLRVLLTQTHQMHSFVNRS
jgi:hypothetical protein